MNVLVIGGGGREHALGWKLKRSPRVKAVFSCPGNAGLARLGPCWSGMDAERDHDSLIEKIRQEKIDLVVVGPEAPLVAGLADRLRSEKIPTFGPGQAASQLEGSKAYSKEFMDRNGIATARFTVVENPDEIVSAVHAFDSPIVVKASGLAAGKGVILTDTPAEAEAVARDILLGDRFGDAGRTVILEERLEGVEMTMLVFLGGGHYQLLESAQDYKPLEEGNRGPNTGGMGAYSPTHLLTSKIKERIVHEVLEPTIRGLESDGIEYQGVLYLGLMLTSGGPKVLEYNVRFGDPEAQPLLLRLRTDLVDVFEAIENSTLQNLPLQWEPDPAVCVVLASEGYPNQYPKGLPITGPVLSDPEDKVQVFHAGTRLNGDRLETWGGRVLGVTATGPTLQDARNAAYARADEIHWEGKLCRRDIGE